MTGSANIPSNMKPGVKPCGHRILVYPIPKERVTASGIVIPDATAQREDMAQVDAVVVRIGPNAWHDQPSGAWCQEGDIVKIAKYVGLYNEGLDGRHYRIINDLDIVGVVEGE